MPRGGPLPNRLKPTLLASATPIFSPPHPLAPQGLFDFQCRRDCPTSPPSYQRDRPSPPDEILESSGAPHLACFAFRQPLSVLKRACPPQTRSVGSGRNPKFPPRWHDASFAGPPEACRSKGPQSRHWPFAEMVLVASVFSVRLAPFQSSSNDFC